MTIRFDNRVAIVTGAGNGLGRSHALALAARGAKVVINDLGGARDGTGAGQSAAENVAQEIVAAGGEAIANRANVTRPDEVAAMVAAAVEKWGRVDILINNAGILRDKSFAKMEVEDFRLVIDVHLNGAAICSKAVWSIMREQGYGRIVMTTSASGLYGNFGQANYSAAKMGLVGLMNTLHLEGAKNGIRVNALAPTALTRMTEDLGLPAQATDLLQPAAVTAGLVYLVSEDAPSRTILGAGAGCYSRTLIYETEGVFLAPSQQTPEQVAIAFERISDTVGQKVYINGSEPVTKQLARATAASAH
ncbi:SDR family NAD(P)-dependent oxidoreductase [Solimonas sp. K1W22B-7]|uniref:SDR family NAD(P)-dependent oxidoreductase n=1 Tax=Solimonas sp. K1W22B-7 TaxID=2303331 RepID=UPI000E335042|nr:SDR family NAD(P)-dependent oxidoreductase [Solimonas sp. K1W22B-7]AXQ30601.1 SDR family NAD(P)-dependent oxidoreductase [Solimonas sp. K1W22B-7]